MLHCENLVKKYSHNTAVNAISFDLNAGQVLSVLGPNGAGKTSLFRMLIGNTLPDSGTIRYHTSKGTIENAIAPHELGYLPEERGLYQDISVLSVLRYLGSLRGVSTSEATRITLNLLEEFGIPEHANRKIKELSKGNQQKVQLISCLINNPRIVILDEPFSGLDPRNQELVISAISRLKANNVGVLISAHQLHLVERMADEVMILDMGKVVLHKKNNQYSDSTVGRVYFLEVSENISIESEMEGIPCEQVSDRLYRLTIDSDQLQSPALTNVLQSTKFVALSRVKNNLHQEFIDVTDHSK